jgi:oxygen-independent coproporphyrinogen-3 oxidase
MLLTLTGAVRFANTSDLDVYLANPTVNTPFGILSASSAPIDDPDIITPEAAFEEFLFLGLRLNEGIPLESLRREFGATLLESVMPALLESIQAGLLHMDTAHIRLTPRGRMVSNEVFSRLLIPAAA